MTTPHFTVFLLSGDIYIHSVSTSRTPNEDPPSISEGVGGRVTDYRINVINDSLFEMKVIIGLFIQSSTSTSNTSSREKVANNIYNVLFNQEKFVLYLYRILESL